jgi:hypothetical protein
MSGVPFKIDKKPIKFGVLVLNSEIGKKIGNYSHADRN